jgi:hypothetical protein
MPPVAKPMAHVVRDVRGSSPPPPTHELANPAGTTTDATIPTSNTGPCRIHPSPVLMTVKAQPTPP